MASCSVYSSRPVLWLGFFLLHLWGKHIVLLSAAPHHPSSILTCRPHQRDPVAGPLSSPFDGSFILSHLIEVLGSSSGQLCVAGKPAVTGRDLASGELGAGRSSPLDTEAQQSDPSFTASNWSRRGGGAGGGTGLCMSSPPPPSFFVLVGLEEPNIWKAGSCHSRYTNSLELAAHMWIKHWWLLMHNIP